MQFLRNIKTGQLEPVDDIGRAEALVKSGLYDAGAEGTRVAVINPDGKQVYTRAQHLRKMLENGYKMATSEEEAAKLKSEQLTDATGKIVAATTGLLSGVGTEALAAGVGKATGTYEEMKLAREYNPGAAIAGEVAGMGVGLLAGGEGLAAKAISKTPVGLITKAGEAITSKVAAKLAAKGAAKRIMGKAAAGAAGSAVEGALYAAGQVIGEDAIGDGETNAQQMIAKIGLGAAFGGVLGGVMHGAGESAKLASEKVLKGATIKEKIKGFLEQKSEDKILQAVIGHNRKAMREVLKKDIASDVVDIMKREGIATAKATPESIAEGINALQQRTAQKLDDLVTKFDDQTEGLLEARVNSDEVADKIAEYAKKFEKSTADRDVYNYLKKEEELIRSKGVRKVQQIAPAEYETRWAPTPDGMGTQQVKELKRAAIEAEHFEPKVFSFREARAERAAYQGKANYSVLAGSYEKDMAEAKRQIATIFNDLLDEKAAPIAEKIGLQKSWKEVRHEYAVMADMQKIADNKLAAMNVNRKISPSDYATGLGSMIAMAKEGGEHGGMLGLESIPLLGPALVTAGHHVVREHGNMWYGLAAEKFAQMRWLERASQDTTKAIGDSIESFFAKGGSFAAKVPTAFTHSPLAQDNKEAREQFAQLASNPAMLADQVSRLTAGMAKNAPQTAQAANQLAVSAVSFLQSKMPKAGPIQASPFEAVQDRKPSSVELAKWQRYVRAVAQPMTVIADLGHGNLNREGIEALRRVYPKLYQQVAQQMLERAADNKAPLTKKQRDQIGVIFGAAANKTQSPRLTATVQAQHAKAQQQEQAKATQTARLTLADKTKSPTQRLQK